MRYDRARDHSCIPRPADEGSCRGPTTRHERRARAEDGECLGSLDGELFFSFSFFFFKLLAAELTGQPVMQIAESGLPLHAFDSFEEAAFKVIALAGG